MKIYYNVLGLSLALGGSLSPTTSPLWAEETQSLDVGSPRATITAAGDDGLRTYELKTTMTLRDNNPLGKLVTFAETPNHPTLRTGNFLFDGLYAMAISEALANSVAEISDASYANGAPMKIDAFQTGELWKYVWTRDLSYSVNLALAGFDPQRSVNSLLFKTSVLKSSVAGGLGNQIIQDTGSGGSYPVSSDRVVWALGADETLKYLAPAEREDFLGKAYPILCDTIEQDRRLVFDPADGLYRGEQSFLDWREQTYPAWTKDNVLPIAMSKALSVNVANYFLLKTTSEYAGRLHQPEPQARYAEWAKALKEAINARFFDSRVGLYSTYLLSEDGGPALRAARYDLLGESLAILLGVADEHQAQLIIQNYPVGPYGPPVVWPEEKSVPIYHNQAMWPFVTAYWIKAAQKAGNTAAVDAGIQSLEKLAALNLSNMENFDFVTGRSEVDDGTRRGPVINSRRQLWSVAGYLSMVQDVVFGLRTSWDGIAFRPFITAQQRNGTFRSMNVIELRNFAYQGTQNSVVVNLPPKGSFARGVCVVDRVELNGQPVSGEFVKNDALLPVNLWKIFLKAPVEPFAEIPVRNVDVSKPGDVFAPAQPQWEDKGGVILEDGRVSLHYRHENAGNVSFNIYRDGALYAEDIRGTKWTDALSGDYRNHVHAYAVTAVDKLSGLCSHPTPVRSYRIPDQQLVISANLIKNSGGKRVATGHFEDWGNQYDDLETSDFVAKQGGRYAVRVEFSNGAGPISTGITCAVKKIEVRAAESGEVVTSGYLVMPQSGDWKRWDMSNSIFADLEAGARYSILISEDGYARNMSYLKNNERYTAGPGGGSRSSNYVNIAGIHLLFSGSPVSGGGEPSAATAQSEPAPRLGQRRRRGKREIAEVL